MKKSEEGEHINDLAGEGSQAIAGCIDDVTGADGWKIES